MNGVDVRPFGPETDARDLVRVHGRSYRTAHEGILPAEARPPPERFPEDHHREFAERWRTSPGDLLVAVDGETVRGFAEFIRDPAETRSFVGPDEAELRAVFVDPDHWGAGIGTALVETGLNRLPDDVERVRVEFLRESDVARNFYVARGFERTGTSETPIAGESYPTSRYARSL